MKTEHPPLEEMLAALKGKTIHLEGEAAFFAAACAGVPIIETSTLSKDTVTFTIAFPASVIIDNGQIKVFTQP